MPTFQINTPILLAGQYFHVRYRLLPAGPWVVIANQTNAAFDITGLSPGQYELEASLAYGSPEIICPPSSYYFSVPNPSYCNCMGITSASVALDANGLTVINVQYIFTEPQAVCGYTVTYVSQDTGISTTLNFPTLPPTELNILVPNPDSECYRLIINMDCCDGNIIECYNEIRCLAEPPECAHIEVLSASIYQISGQFYLQINITQSTPVTNIFDIYYFQFNNFISGVGDSGTIAYGSGGALTLTFPINPNFNIQYGTKVTYNGSLVDGCRFLTKFEAEYDPT